MNYDQGQTHSQVTLGIRIGSERFLRLAPTVFPKAP